MNNLCCCKAFSFTKCKIISENLVFQSVFSEISNTSKPSITNHVDSMIIFFVHLKNNLLLGNAKSLCCFFFQFACHQKDFAKYFKQAAHIALSNHILQTFLKNPICFCFSQVTTELFRDMSHEIVTTCKRRKPCRLMKIKNRIRYFGYIYQPN